MNLSINMVIKTENWKSYIFATKAKKCHATSSSSAIGGIYGVLSGIEQPGPSSCNVLFYLMYHKKMPLCYLTF